RIKCLIREYYLTKSEAVKKEFEEANVVFPFLFSRAWAELKMERASAPTVGARETPLPSALDAGAIDIDEDVELARSVAGIEDIIREIEGDLQSLKAAGKLDDILLQTCRKLITRAQESLATREASGFATRRLEMTRNSLTTTLRQVK